MANVRLDGMLSEFVRERRLDTNAGSVKALLSELEERYPRLRHRLWDETQTVRRFVRVYVNGEDIRGLHGVETPLGPKDSVEILHSIQGG